MLFVSSRPIEKHDTEVGQIHSFIQIEVGASIGSIPTNQENRKVD